MGLYKMKRQMGDGLSTLLKDHVYRLNDDFVMALNTEFNEVVAEPFDPMAAKEKGEDPVKPVPNTPMKAEAWRRTGEVKGRITSGA